MELLAFKEEELPEESLDIPSGHFEKPKSRSDCRFLGNLAILMRLTLAEQVDIQKLVKLHLGGIF
jgi:hypothetical protein